MFFVLTQRLPPLCAPLWERPRPHRTPNQYNLNLKIMQMLLNGGDRLLLKIFIFSIEAVGQFAYPERPATKDNWLCTQSWAHAFQKLKYF